jgi:GTP-binding protein LepA
MTDPRLIRNFCIVAHIDHGKSTLADRLIEKAKVIDERFYHAQMTDNMDIERERGITIKSQAVTIPYTANNGTRYLLNFVDTPGHVDFTYEVSRAIASCEGALLIVDAAQGVESQTLSNMYLALEHNLEILPVINKIDLPAADIPSTLHQINHDLGLDPDIAVQVSAKHGTGIDELFEAIVERIPPPVGDAGDVLRALIFDCHYDSYRGVIIHIRVFSGTIKPGQTIRFMNSESEYKVEETGVFILKLVPSEELAAGDVGYIIAGIKTIHDVKVGDTITNPERPCDKPLPVLRK